jgi:hypothetical protein
MENKKNPSGWQYKVSERLQSMETMNKSYCKSTVRTNKEDM